jgi:two-component system chemotaxis sensor kinase CheA
MAPQAALKNAFLHEAQEQLNIFEQTLILLEESNPNPTESFNTLFRTIHTLKGGSMFFALSAVVNCAEATESYLDDLRNKRKELSKEGLSALFSALDFIKAELIAGCSTDHRIEDILLSFNRLDAEINRSESKSESASPMEAPQAWSPNIPKSGMGFVRVSPQLLEQSLDQMGEISIFKAILRAKYPNDSDITNLTERLNFLQNSILKMRMERVDTEFQKYTRLVRDLAQSLNKKIKLAVQESTVEVDRIVIAALSEPMIHLLRNCADHGIEDSERRVQLGKPAVGTIMLQAAQSGGNVIIEVSDDGAGIDPERLKAHAISRGIVTQSEATSLTTQAAIELIFRPGFTTTDKATGISGRGVGMDSVRSAIEGVGGTIAVASQQGKGTKFTATFPLSLAVSKFLCISLAGKTYLIYKSAIEEIISIREAEAAGKLRKSDSSLYIQHRESLIPVIDLAHAIGRPRPTGQHQFLILTRHRNRFIALQVDKFRSVEELPHKAMPQLLGKSSYFSGVTMTGKGELCPVIDIRRIIQLSGIHDGNDDFGQEKQKISLKDSTLNIQESILRFEAAPNEIFGISSSFVSEIVRVNLSSMQSSGNARFIEVKGTFHRLIFLDSHMPAGPIANNLTQVTLIILNDRYPIPMAVVANRAVGIASMGHHEAERTGEHPAIMETLNHEGTIVRVIDVDYLANLQLPESARIRTKSLNGLIALVADDSSFFRGLLVRYLTELGVSVTTAVNGRDAYNTLLQMNPKPDFILSDLTMPDMNGLEFVQQMRSHREFADIPAIAVSTIRDRSEIARALEVGFNDYEVKVNRESLIKKIQQIMESHDARFFQEKNYSKAS